MPIVILCVGVLSGLLGSVARAQDAEQPIVDAAPEEGARARSRALAIRAQERFAQGDTDQATALLLEARTIYPEPLLSYNLARVYDSIGDHQNAFESYTRYLEESPDAANRAPVELRISALQETIEALDAQPVSAPGPRQAPPNSGPGAWPWVVVVAGGAALLSASVLGGLARSTHNDAAEESEHLARVESLDRAERQARAANVLFAVGGTVTGVGVLWGIIAALRAGGSSSPDDSPPDEGLQVQVDLGVNNATVNLQW